MRPPGLMDSPKVGGKIDLKWLVPLILLLVLVLILLIGLVFFIKSFFDFQNIKGMINLEPGK